MQEKLLLYYIKMANAYIYKGVLELSLALLNSTIISTKMRSENLFYLRGLLECFPLNLPTLFNYIEWDV
jgi:hypothetical protein